MPTTERNRQAAAWAEHEVRASILATQELTGEWFAARELRAGVSYSTAKKYLDLMVSEGELERRIFGGRYVFYRLPEGK